jgi:hypothetical protein
MFILVTGLFIAGGDFVSEQRETSIQTELEVVSEQVVADISMADRLAQTMSGNETVRVRRSAPDRVAGSSYAIAVEGGSDPKVVLRTVDPAVEVTVPIRNETDLEMTTINGGPLVVNYTDDALRVERSESR